MSDSKTIDSELDEIIQAANQSASDNKSSPPNNTTGNAGPTSEEDNMDYDSEDDDDSKSNHSTSKNDRPRGDKKRRHHNVLERKRRYLIKDSFTALRDNVPTLKCEKASRTQILKKAAEFIQQIHKKNQITRADIDELEKKNLELEKRLLASGKLIEKTKETPSVYVVVEEAQQSINLNQKQ